MNATTVVNLKGHRDDPGFSDVVYVGRAMHRGGWHLAASPLANPFRLGADGDGDETSPGTAATCSIAPTCWRYSPSFAGSGSAAGARRCRVTPA